MYLVLSVKNVQEQHNSCVNNFPILHKGMASFLLSGTPKITNTRMATQRNTSCRTGVPSCRRTALCTSSWPASQALLGPCVFLDNYAGITSDGRTQGRRPEDSRYGLRWAVISCLRASARTAGEADGLQGRGASACGSLRPSQLRLLLLRRVRAGPTLASSCPDLCALFPQTGIRSRQ